MLIKFLGRAISCIILIIPVISNGAIIKVNDLEQIQSKFTELYQDYTPADILLIVGVKKVLLKPHLPELGQIDNNVIGSLYKTFQSIKPPRMHYLDTVLLTEYDNQLLNSDLPEFIKSVIGKGTPVILSDPGLTGNFNNIKNLEQWKAEYFKKFNIDLSKSFPAHNYIIFNNMTPFDNTYPAFYHGILSSNIAPPAQLITNFLAYTKFMPKVLVVIDSEYTDLNSLEIQIKNYNDNIVFIGYNYVAQYQQSTKFDKVPEIKKFMQALIEKINKVKRHNPPLKAKSKTNENPYDIKE